MNPNSPGQPWPSSQPGFHNGAASATPATSQRMLIAIGGGCVLLLLSVLGFVFAGWFWGLLMILLAVFYAAQLWAEVDVLEDPVRVPVRMWDQLKEIGGSMSGASGEPYTSVMARQRQIGLIAPGPQHSPGTVPPDALPHARYGARQQPPYPHQPPQYPHQPQRGG